MKNSKTKNLLLLFLLVYSGAYTQQIHKSVYEKFPPSIVAKVYQYDRQKHLSEKQQLQMAAHFQRIDSIMVENLRQGKPPRDIDKIYASAYSEVYINTYLDKIRAIKKIPEPALQRIKTQFFGKAEMDVYADWSTVLLEATQAVLTDTAVFSALYKHLIKKQSVTLSAAERINLISVHHISKDEFFPVVKLVESKCYQQVLMEYTYAGSPRKRDSMIIVTNNYHDSLITSALLKDGSLMNSSQFAMALKYKKKLGLRPSLTDTLLFHAMYISKQKDAILKKDPFAKTDTKAYEAQWMNQLLTEDQYTMLLSLKNTSQARIDAANDWADIETRGISIGMDKESTMKELYSYYMQKWNAYYRLANDEIKQESNLRILKDNAPKSLKMLLAAKKLPNPVNANTNVNFKW